MKIEKMQHFLTTSAVAQLPSSLPVLTGGMLSLRLLDPLTRAKGGGGDGREVSLSPVMIFLYY